MRAGLPWPRSNGAAPPPALAPPRLIRPPADAWLVSATLHLLDDGGGGSEGAAAGGRAGAGGSEGAAARARAWVDAGAGVSASLCRALGWDRPPRASVLCAQLLELGQAHAVKAEVRARV